LADDEPLENNLMEHLGMDSEEDPYEFMSENVKNNTMII